MVPTCMPPDGFTPGCTVPFIVTLFGTKVVPAGIGSVTITLVAGIFPVFGKVIVYVIISPISAICGLAVFVGFTIAVRTEVVVGGGVVVVVVGGSVGFGCDVYVTLASLVIVPLVGREVTWTRNVTVVVWPAGIVPNGIFVGVTPDCAVPLTVTLFGIKVVPVGIGSVIETFVAEILPLFGTVMV
ncbi:hypothetical protein BC30102_3666 [Bacillus cereus]|nr:hypothetical protein BC30102_3666 [Bacillus cereus]